MMNTGPDPEVVAAFREMMRPAMPTSLDADLKCIELDFDSAGLPIVAGVRRVIRLPFSARITGVYGYASAPTTATFTLALGTSVDWPANSPISSAAYSFSMGGLAFMSFDISAWVRELNRDDVLDCVLASVSGGLTHLLVAIDIRKGPSMPRGFGTYTVGDDASNAVVDDNGNPVVDRS